MLTPPGDPAPDSAGRRSGPAVTLDLRVPSNPAPRSPSWAGPAGEGDDPDAAPHVVLADRAGCGEFTVLQTMLRRLGVPSVRIDAEGVTALGLRVRPGEPSIVLSGRRIVPTVVWTRHFSPRAMPAGADPAVTMVRADSWTTLMAGLAALAPSALPGSRPDRLEQLATAARAGLRVPETIVTTDPAAAAREIQADRLVVKVVGEHFAETSPGLLVGVLPQIVTRRELQTRPAPGHPVIVQEYVDHDAELRVYHLGGTVHAYAVDKPSPDAPWRDEARVRVTQVPAPPAVVAAVRELAGRWNLTYGAFDLLVRGTEVVFLEVNPDGDWRWFEAAAGGTAVSAAAASMVRTLHLNALRDAGAPPPVEIVDFLLLGAPAPGGSR
ncbi:hypothetical protein Sme01_42140 [Sphaerisporangium melleum]|uniref:ATP-grasp domain-containing protein n=1 Tax=Sphaerisporangium melleum TaxID=321316 RepID=A0A917RJZ3_9ACTN|nr:hypothetical protein [Sphaerisporangium melleum]GGL11360.1 hypothetical protein GCM10007964_61890 [Sphaerisporangium melleum]GII71738.1 hypothetical protein Sme01_42140 [Sphaerisporangium melleum]